MAEVTINIPDPIFEIIKKRAEIVNNTPEGLIVANLAIIFGVARYKPEKWLKFMKNKEDMSVPWD